MRTQHDMFDPSPDDDPDIVTDSPPDDPVARSRLAPLAAPCGFRDRSNQPCARLATKPLSIDGAPLVCRGVLMLLCDPACFRGSLRADNQSDVDLADAVGPDDDLNMGRDPDDPGYDDTWGDGAWERDDGQDAQ